MVTAIRYDPRASDSELIEKVYRDPLAFEEIHRRYSKNLYYALLKRIGRKEDAEDLAQRIWTGVFNNLKTFRFEASFKTYLYNAMRNEIRVYRRGKSRNRLEFPDETKYNSHIKTYSTGIDEERTIIKRTQLKDLKEIIEELNENPNAKELSSYCHTSLGEALLKIGTLDNEPYITSSDLRNPLELKRKLKNILDALSLIPETKMRTLLSHATGGNLEEIAEREGIKKQNVFNRSSKARKKIREILQLFDYIDEENTQGGDLSANAAGRNKFYRTWGFNAPTWYEFLESRGINTTFNGNRERYDAHVRMRNFVERVKKQEKSDPEKLKTRTPGKKGRPLNYYTEGRKKWGFNTASWYEFLESLDMNTEKIKK